MPLIKITELDLTSPGNNAQETDVVYIPGLVDYTQEDLYDKKTGEYIGLKYREPTYIDSIAQFETWVGKNGVVFDKDQKYSALMKETENGTITGFSEDAIPVSGVMFTKGTVDPSYIMAKELLSAGLPIVYERINPDASLVAEVPDTTDWKVSYNEYYKEVEGYKINNSKTPTLLFTSHKAGESLPSNISVPCYTRFTAKDTDDYVYVQIPDNIVLEHGVYKFKSDCYIKTDASVFKMTSYDFSDVFESGKFYKFDPSSEEADEKGYVVLTEKPGDWGPESEVDYYRKDKDPGNEYTLVTLVTVDDKKVLPDFLSGTYYKYNKSKDVYEPLTSKPTDWESKATTKYYVLNADGESDGYTPVNYAALAYTKYNKEGTLYKKDEKTNLFVEVLKEELPEHDDYIYLTYFIKNEDTFLPKDVTEVSVIETEDAVSGYSVPKNYIQTFNEYCIDETVTEIREAVEEDDPENGKYFIHDSFIDIRTIYEALDNVFAQNAENTDNALFDMGNMSIKYITSGGYPTYEYNNNTICSKMINLASKRGDCIAFIDHTNNPDRTTNINSLSSLYQSVINDSTFNDNGEYATMFTPYMNFTRITSDENNKSSTCTMSGTFGYLLALAQSLKVNPAWLAIAGANRGAVPHLQKTPTNTPITNGNADNMQPRDGYSVNAITEIKPYGQCIWGNRTLKNNGKQGNLTATSFLNIRNLICDVKKTCYKTARALTFEQNDDILWINFKAKISSTLDKMVSGYGISGYKILQDTEHKKANEKATLCAKVIIYPTYATEDFYITVVLKDDEVGIEE